MTKRKLNGFVIRPHVKSRMLNSFTFQFSSNPFLKSIDIDLKSLRIFDLIRKISLNYDECRLTSTILISARVKADTTVD